MQSQITIDRFLRHQRSSEYQLNAYEKLVLFFLASYMGNKSICFPSISSLSNDCSLSVDTIKRAIKSLERKRLIEVTRILGRSNQYSFNLNLIKKPSAGSTQCLQPPGADSTTNQVQEALSPSAQSTTNNNSNNIIKSTSIYSDDRKLSKGSGAKINNTSDVKEIFQYWQMVMKHPKARLDKKRKQRIKNALTNYSKDELKKAIDGCSSSPFHMGKNDDGRIYDDIELILRDSTRIEQFINYHNKSDSGNNNDNSTLPEFMEGAI